MKSRISGLETISRFIVGESITNCKVYGNKIAFHVGDKYFVISLNKDGTKLSSKTELNHRELVLLGIISIEDYFKIEDKINSDIDKVIEPEQEIPKEKTTNTETLKELDKIVQETREGISSITDHIIGGK